MAFMSPFKFLWAVVTMMIFSVLGPHVDARPLSIHPDAFKENEIALQHLVAVQEHSQKGPNEHIHTILRIKEENNTLSMVVDIKNDNEFPVTIVGWPFPSKDNMDAIDEEEAAKEADSALKSARLGIPIMNLETQKGILQKLLIEVAPGQKKEIPVFKASTEDQKDRWYHTLPRAMDGHWRVWPFAKDVVIQETISRGYENVLDLPGGLDSYWRTNTLQRPARSSLPPLGRGLDIKDPIQHE